MEGHSSYPLVRFGSDSSALVLQPSPQASSFAPVTLLPRRRRFVPVVWVIIFLLLLLRLCRRQIVALRQQANYWQAMHGRAKRREQDLHDQVRQLQAQVRELEQRLYGRRSETSSVHRPESKTTPPRSQPKRPRGQQAGKKGPSRRSHDHLPATHEDCTLPPDQRDCPQCHRPFTEIPGTDDGTLLEVEVRAHRRVYHRRRYRPTCACGCQPGVITAPPPPKVIPKSNLGVSIWVALLQRKFAFFQPLTRILAELSSSARLDLSAGTVTGGMQKLVPLVQPLYEELVDRNRDATHWHADETRWLVFVPRDDKPGFAWTLWVFAAKDAVVFVLDPTRAHDVPQQHFGEAQGILSVDRYCAYPAMKQVKEGHILLAFCWAHVRRDFLAVLTGWTELTDWAWSWVLDIGLLYQRNDERLAHELGTPVYADADRLLREHVAHLAQRRDLELTQADLRLPQKKVLTSLKNHWQGLTRFLDHPHVPLDNNEAERCHRGPVLARKNFYGSGALWSGRLAAMLFSLFQTLDRWKLNLHDWLTWYLTACAEAGGKPPPNPSQFLPWNLSEQRRQTLSRLAQQKPIDAP
jgi:transposase